MAFQATIHINVLEFYKFLGAFQEFIGTLKDIISDLINVDEKPICNKGKQR
jgi:hypothetical protein